jgi:hypothetical protein
MMQAGRPMIIGHALPTLPVFVFVLRRGGIARTGAATQLRTITERA